MLQGRLALDRDLARFKGLWDLANEIDRQQTIAEIGSVHPDMVGKLEPVFERTAGNAAMQISEKLVDRLEHLELVEESFVRGEPVLQLTIIGQAMKARLLH